jgi:hypothetical protein
MPLLTDDSSYTPFTGTVYPPAPVTQDNPVQAPPEPVEPPPAAPVGNKPGQVLVTDTQADASAEARQAFNSLVTSGQIPVDATFAGYNPKTEMVTFYPPASPLVTQPWLFTQPKQPERFTDTLPAYQKPRMATIDEFKSMMTPKEQSVLIRYANRMGSFGREITFDELTPEQQRKALDYFSATKMYIGQTSGLTKDEAAQRVLADAVAQGKAEIISQIPVLGTIALIKSTQTGRIPTIGDAVLVGVSVAGDALVFYPMAKGLTVLPRELAWGTQLTIVNQSKPLVSFVVNTSKKVGTTFVEVGGKTIKVAKYAATAPVTMAVGGRGIPISTPKIVSSKKFITVQGAEDVGMSVGQFDDFIKARGKDPTLTPEQFKARPPVKVAYPQQKIPSAGADIDDFDAAVIRQKPTEGSNSPWNTELSEDTLRELVKQQNKSAAADLVRRAAENDAKWRAMAAASLARIPPKGQATTFTPVEYNSKTDTVTLASIDAQGRVKVVTTTIPRLTEVVQTKSATELSTKEQEVFEEQVREQVQEVVKTTTKPATETKTETETSTSTASATKTATETATKTETRTQTQPVTQTETKQITRTATTVTAPPDESKPPKPPEKLRGRPPKKLRIRLPSGDSEESDKKVYKPGSVAWKQGFGYYVAEPDDKTLEDLDFTIKKPQGVIIAKDAKSAAATIQVIRGTSAPDFNFDMGIMNVKIRKAPRTPNRSAGRKAITFQVGRPPGRRPGIRSKKIGYLYVAGEGMVSRRPIGKRKGR